MIPGSVTSVDLDVEDSDYDALYIDITQMPSNGRIDSIVYNSDSLYGEYYDSIGKEVGDEISLALDDQVLTSFTFEYWSDIDDLTQSATGVIKIYSQEGGEEYADLGQNVIEPNRLLYVSNNIDIESGFNSVVLDGILLVVPSKITWTFEVSTDDSINAGVVFSKDPSQGEGESADDLGKENRNWTLNRASSGSFASETKNNFRAKVFAYDRESTILNYIPDPGFTGKNIVNIQ